MAGGTAPNYSVVLTIGTGIAGTVSFSVTGLPSGASASFNPSTLTASGSTTLSIPTSPSTPPGTYSLIITASSGGLVSTVRVTLVVVAGFVMSVSPSSNAIGRGQSGTYAVTVTADPGFSGTVTFSKSGLPSGTTANFNPSSVPSSGSSTLSVQVGATAATGTYTFHIKGTCSSLVQSTIVATLIIQ